MKNLKAVVYLLLIYVILCSNTLAQEQDSLANRVEKLFNQAAQYHNAGELQQALELYTKVIELDSTHAGPYWNRSIIYGQQERYERAISDLRKVNELAPEFSNAYGRQGWYFILLGRFDEAKQPTEKALELTPETMAWTVNLGHIYLLTGKPDSARVYYEKSLPLLKSEAEFQAGPVADLQLFMERGWQPKACAQELAWFEHQFSGNYRHYLQADSLSTQAKTLYEQQDFLQAASLFLRAVAAEEAAKSPRQEDLALTLSWAGISYYHAGKYSDAELLFQRALAIHEKVLGPEHPDVAQSLNNLAALYRTQGKYADAEPLYQRALAIYEKVLEPEHPDVATSLNNLAALYFTQGKYADAEPLYQRSLAIVEKVLGPEHQYMATSLNNLAALYDTQGKYADAEPLHQRALAIHEKVLGPEHPDVANSLNSLAVLYFEQGKYSDAELLFQRALAIREKVLGPEHLYVAKSLNNLAVLYATQGKYAEAEPLYQRVLAIREKVLEPEHPAVAYSLRNLAHLSLDLNHTEQADSLFNRALRIFETTTGAPKHRISAYAGRALLRWRQGQRTLAFSNLDEALNAAEDLRPQVSGGEETRASFFKGFAWMFQRMVDWQIEIGDIRAAFEYAERGRARSLLDQLHAANIDIRNGLPPELKESLLKRETEAGAKLAEYEQRINVLRADKSMPEEAKFSELASLQKQRTAADRVFQAVYQEIKASSLITRDAVGEPVSLSTIQRTLVPRNGLLLMYQLGEKRSYLFVVPPGRGEPDAVPLSASDQAAKALEIEPGDLTADQLEQILVKRDSLAAYAKLRQRNVKAIGGLPPLFSKLHALWSVLLPDTVWQRVSNSEEIVLIPDGPLHLLPFEMLVVKSGTNQTQTRFWLDEGPVIRYAASASALHRLTNRPGKYVIPSIEQKAVLSLSDPVYDVTKVQQAEKQRTSKESYAALTHDASLFDRREVVRSNYIGRGGVLMPLPGTADETEAIEKAFGSSGILGQVTPLQQFAASEINLRTEILGKRYIHLATHGLVNQRRKSLFSALALTPPATESNDPKNDGFLQLHEIYDLKLDGCELAVLSACETNIGEYIEGEGVFALSRGFLTAGARRVIASQWSVNDSSTAALMSAFFTQIAEAEKQGKQIDYARALRDAKLAVRKQKKWADPFFWAPFVSVGKE